MVDKSFSLKNRVAANKSFASLLPPASVSAGRHGSECRHSEYSDASRHHGNSSTQQAVQTLHTDSDW